MRPLTTKSTSGRNKTRSVRPYHILSLDGGGIRGLSSLYILNELMLFMGPDAKPCDYFDLICGTSTGGLIALMLGRLRMSVKECIDAYRALAEEVFNKSFPAQVLSLVEKRTLFDSTKLEKIIKGIVAEQTGDENDLLFELNNDCRTFVLAVESSNVNNQGPTLFRSYDDPTQDTSPSICTIWQAARATSAAPFFFSPAQIDGKHYLDGGLLANNPALEALQEAERLWPRRSLGCLVSIGTGTNRTITFSARHRLFPLVRDALIFVKAVVERALSSEGPHYILQGRKEYSRFNVEGLGSKVDLQKWKKMEDIHLETALYLSRPEIRKALQECGDQLLAFNLAQSGAFSSIRHSLVVSLWDNWGTEVRAVN